LKEGRDINLKDMFDMSPLRYAIEERKCEDRYKVIELLLKHGANPNEMPTDNHFSHLKEAIFMGDERAVELLIYYGANIREPVMLIFAIKWESSTTIFKKLLQAGADQLDETLMMAFKIENHEIVEALLDAGADINLFFRLDNREKMIRLFKNIDRLKNKDEKIALGNMRLWKAIRLASLVN
jgi:ankyrin repeat protein